MTDPGSDGRVDPGLRTLRRLGVGGLGASFALAVLVGLLGATGEAGAAVFLLSAALTSSLVGLVGVWTLVRDDHRGDPISRGRIIATVAGFAGATLLMAMLVGVGASIGAN